MAENPKPKGAFDIRPAGSNDSVRTVIKSARPDVVDLRNGPRKKECRPSFKEDVFFHKQEESDPVFPESGLATGDDIPNDGFFQGKGVEEGFFSDFSGYVEDYESKRGRVSALGKSALLFGLAALAIGGLIGGAAYWQRAKRLKGDVLGVSQKAFEQFVVAAKSTVEAQFDQSSLDFDLSYEKFSQASESLDGMGEAVISLSRFFPVASQLASGKHMLEAGKELSLAGKHLSGIGRILADLQNPVSDAPGDDRSFLVILREIGDESKEALAAMEKAKKSLDLVKVDDLPDDKRSQFILLKKEIPGIIGILGEFYEKQDILADLLGGRGFRKYLFLFQNNHEMRATGGFIGSYGLIDIKEGRVRNFLVDGIFNPDGQLKDKIVPPFPIQKISAAWSLHDSNWFPHFPVSAEKAILFYEKTGGPTVDGVITLTPTIMERLLKIIGPVKMEDHGVVLTADNFVELVQHEVEVGYDKAENNPKKILADLAPIILDKIFNDRDTRMMSEAVGIFLGGLNEKHILLYSRDGDIQELISQRRWAGEILESPKDYLSVINSNINGYKTDGVVKENIKHEAVIGEDGTVINEVAITRRHLGGDTSYEWWNKVNADYMRVYVPLGAELLEVDGHTKENVQEPLDYDALDFSRDEDVEAAEKNTIPHPSGTRVYEEAGKTVFANWVYVSPQETVTIRYRYRLPFKIVPDKQKNPAVDYSLLVQKQPGSSNTDLESEVRYPAKWNLEWKTPFVERTEQGLKLTSPMEVDRFWGAVFSDD